jgi:hypothetical protein
MGCSTNIRLKEHQRHTQLEHLDKSAIAEHSINKEHRIQFHNSSILATNTRYMDHIVREATETDLPTLTISTERVTFVSVNQGSLLSAP